MRRKRTDSNALLFVVFDVDISLLPSPAARRLLARAARKGLLLLPAPHSARNEKDENTLSFSHEKEEANERATIRPFARRLSSSSSSRTTFLSLFFLSYRSSQIS